MALKRYRKELAHDNDIRYYFNMVGDAGGMATVATGITGSGGMPGDPHYVATYAPNPSGQTPAGILMQEVINIDQTRFHINFQREQVPVNYKVCLNIGGEYSTNMVLVAPTGRQPAYLAASGNFSATQASGAPLVGEFLGAPDGDNYCVVRIKLD